MSLTPEQQRKADDEQIRTYWESHQPKFKHGEQVCYQRDFIVKGRSIGRVATVLAVGSDGEQFRYEIEFDTVCYRLSGVKESELRRFNERGVAAQAQAHVEVSSEFWRAYKRKFTDGERVMLATTAQSAMDRKYGRVQALHDTSHERRFATEFHYVVAYDDGTYEHYEAERNLQRAR